MDHISNQKLDEIRATFDRAERIIEESKGGFVEEHIRSTHDVLGWVLGEYTQNPLEDY